MNKCTYCEEQCQTVTKTADGKSCCAACIHDNYAYCNKDNKYYLAEEVLTCEQDETTYHADHMTEASDGFMVFADNLEAYEESIDLNNYSEYDRV